MKPLDSAKSLALLLLAMVAFYWKLILSSQFSLLTNFETVTQAYSWFHFWVESVRQGTLPVWDPYAFAGRSYTGEMQTAAFYPLHLVLALFPFDRNGLLAPLLYHLYFVAVHVMAAWFMFALIRELGLSRFSAVIAGLCFSIGGFVGRVLWPHMLESSIWLPIQLLFLLRALDTKALFRGLAYAALSGFALGLSILAGGLHIVMMQGLVLTTAIAYHTVHKIHKSGVVTAASPDYKMWKQPILILLVAVSIGLALGAIQLLPSMEYSARAMRWVNGGAVLPAAQKIPYSNLVDSLSPRGLVSYLFFETTNLGPGEVLSPYLGVFPLLLAIIGIWKCWGNLWVRYAAGLAFAAILFSLGSYSLFYGLVYAIVPLLWMAREASRFLYLAHFGLVILAAFGVESLFSKTETPSSWNHLNRAFLWLTVACAAALAAAAVFPLPAWRSETMFSFVVIFLSYALWRYIRAGASGNIARFLVAALILFDVSAFDSAAENKAEMARAGGNHLDRLLSMRPAVQFLKSRPGLFRVQVAAETPLNPGDAFDLQTLNGGAVTMPSNYFELQSKGLLASNLLNVQYFLKPATTADPGPLYEDSKWKVYKNPQAFPRAWLVHQTAVEPSPEMLLRRLGTPGSEPEHLGLLAAPLEIALEPASTGTAEDASVEQYSARHILLKVRAGSRGLLVLSEMYYPGWEVRVNGHREKVYEVDGGLRGVIVPQGDSRVTFEYVPRSVIIGGLLSILAFSAALLLLISLVSKRAGMPAELPN